MNPRFRSLALLVFASLPLAAQVDHASLSGTVTDASGAVVQGAKVETRSAETDFRRQTNTGTGGTYEIPGLPIGSYTVTFSKEGFRPTEVKGVELAVGQPRTIDARLEVGAITEAVEVTATLETLNRTSAEVGGSVEAAQIKELPVDDDFAQGKAIVIAEKCRTLRLPKETQVWQQNELSF